MLVLRLTSISILTKVNPYKIFNSTNVLSEALQKLQTVVSLSGFVIHPVPSDSNYMFSAVSHQLHNTSVASVESSGLRQLVASHLEAKSAL